MMQDVAVTRFYPGGNSITDAPDSTTERTDRNGGSMMVVIEGQDVTYLFDRAEAINRGLITEEENSDA